MGAEITRRAFGAGAIALAAATAIDVGTAGAAPLPPARPRRATSSTPRIVGVDISQHPVPFPPKLQEVLEFDQAWLDHLAQQYWDDYASHLGRPLNDYDRADFWFRYIAIPLQEKAMLGRSLGTKKARIEKDLALIHMVGYYGGIWFGKKLDEFLGNSTTSKCATPDPVPSDDKFDAMAVALDRAIKAGREGTDAQAIEAAENLLRGGDLVFYLSNGLPTLNGMIGGYAYNVGYTNAILVPDNRALPPPANANGPSPFNPPWNSFQFTTNGVFDATYPDWSKAETANSVQPLPPNPGPFTPVPYLTGDVPALRMSRALFEGAKASNPAGYDRVKQGVFDRSGNVVNRGDLSVLSQAAFNTGTATWTAVPTLNIRPWDDPSYNLILALSIYFVQALQAPGQALMAAAVNDDGPQARNALMTAAISMPFGLSYLISLRAGNSGRYACYTADQSIPPFVFAAASDDSAAAGPLSSSSVAGTSVESVLTSRSSSAATRLAATGGSSRERILVAGALAAAGVLTSRLTRPIASSGDAPSVPDHGAPE